MATNNKVSKKEMVSFLLENDAQDVNEKRMIVLLPNSKKMRELNNQVAQEVRDNLNFSFDKTTAFNVTNSMIRHSKRKIFLGLNKDAELLEGEYSLEEIKTYGED